MNIVSIIATIAVIVIIVVTRSIYSYINAHYVYVYLYTDTIIHLERFYTDTYILYTISILFHFHPLLFFLCRLCVNEIIPAFQLPRCHDNVAISRLWMLDSFATCSNLAPRAVNILSRNVY